MDVYVLTSTYCRYGILVSSWWSTRGYGCIWYIIRNWSCTPITDYFSYANRLWTVGSGDVTGIVYGTCDSRLTSPPPPPIMGYLHIVVFRHIISRIQRITFINLHYGCNNGPNSIYVEVESADSDPVDLLIINSATPGYALGTMTTIGGKYRNDMTWNYSGW